MDKALSRDEWIWHVLHREAENMIFPHTAAFLEGKYQPRDNAERLALLGVCQFRDLNRAVARLYADTFAADPKLAEDPLVSHRYNAARAAALAGCGRGKDGSNLGEEERAHWREQARAWLRDELVAKRALLAGAPTAELAALPVRLESWLKEPALVCARDEGELRKLPPAEREAWLALWRDVRSLLTEARSAIAKTSP
jgi:serine/threonine-protein kinase